MLVEYLCRRRFNVCTNAEFSDDIFKIIKRNEMNADYGYPDLELGICPTSYKKQAIEFSKYKSACFRGNNFVYTIDLK